MFRNGARESASKGLPWAIETASCTNRQSFQNRLAMICSKIHFSALAFHFLLVERSLCDFALQRCVWPFLPWLLVRQTVDCRNRNLLPVDPVQDERVCAFVMRSIRPPDCDANKKTLVNCHLGTNTERNRTQSSIYESSTNTAMMPSVSCEAEYTTERSKDWLSGPEKVIIKATYCMIKSCKAIPFGQPFARSNTAGNPLPTEIQRAGLVDSVRKWFWNTFEFL